MSMRVIRCVYIVVCGDTVRCMTLAELSVFSESVCVLSISVSVSPFSDMRQEYVR